MQDWKVDLIQKLKNVVGAESCDGDCSCQVLLPTKDGRALRVGLTDEDVADRPGEIWFKDGLSRWLENNGPRNLPPDNTDFHARTLENAKTLYDLVKTDRGYPTRFKLSFYPDGKDIMDKVKLVGDVVRKHGAVNLKITFDYMKFSGVDVEGNMCDREFSTNIIKELVDTCSGKPIAAFNCGDGACVHFDRELNIFGLMFAGGA